ncbi:hypothetical protein [Haloglycomyces albus]|uniref:hypothetical protein n=1 Tax=Haloglycomyces albus TaxID=526067 RepID=UPI0004B4A4F6|nr:hypothetical protein [Haloglycomyces albus]
MGESVAPILLMALAGILAGGSYTLRQNDKTLASLICGLIGMVAFAYAIYVLYGPQ